MNKQEKFVLSENQYNILYDIQYRMLPQKFFYQENVRKLLSFLIIVQKSFLNL